MHQAALSYVINSYGDNEDKNVIASLENTVTAPGVCWQISMRDLTDRYAG